MWLPGRQWSHIAAVEQINSGILRSMTAKPKSRSTTTVPPEKEADRSPAQKRRPWYIALLIVGVLLLGASIYLAMSGVLADLERRIFDVVNHAYLQIWVTDSIAKPVSNAVWGMVGLVGILLLVPKYRLLAWQYAVAAGSSYVVVFALEHLVERARPSGLEAYDVVLRAMQGGPGFPSGHVAVLAALGLTIWPLVSWPWRVFTLLLIGSEAWARVFLGLHAPLDIVGGIAVAMTVVAIIHLTPAKIRKVFWIAA